MAANVFDFKLNNIVIVLDEGKNLEIYRTQKENKIFLLIPEDVKKIDSEDSCPCGSGKPYNKCCGR